MMVQSLTLKLALILFFVIAADVRAESTCGSKHIVCNPKSGACTIQCAWDGFVVALPAGWSTSEEADKSLSVHLKSPTETQNAGNCPIVSAVNIDPGKALDEIKESATSGQIGKFWDRVFQQAGLRVIGGGLQNWISIESDSSITFHESRKSAKNDKNAIQFALVEAILQRGKEGKLLRVWQAVYFKFTKISNGRYIPARVYFVNCTTLDPANSNSPKVLPQSDGRPHFQAIGDKCDGSKPQALPSAFCTTLKNFDEVFASFTSRECFENVDGSRIECEGEPSLSAALKRDAAASPATPVIQAEVEKSLADMAAQVAAMGAK